MDNNKLSTKNPQLDSPRTIHTFWIKATCNARFCVPDASEQKTNSLELTDRLPRHGPSDWDKVTKDERSVFRFSHIYLEQNTRTPMKTRMDASKHNEAICVRDAGMNPQFSWTIFPYKKCTLQNLPMDSPKRRNGLSVLLVDCPFCGKRIFGENFSSPTDDFEGSKMRGYCLGQAFVGVPIFAWAYVSLQLIGGFCNGP